MNEYITQQKFDGFADQVDVLRDEVNLLKEIIIGKAEIGYDGLAVRMRQVEVDVNEIRGFLELQEEERQRSAERWKYLIAGLAIASGGSLLSAYEALSRLFG